MKHSINTTLIQHSALLTTLTAYPFNTSRLMNLANAVTPLNIVLAGASGAIGQALLQQLLAMPNTQTVYVLHRTDMANGVLDSRVRLVACDITQTLDLQGLAARLKADEININVLMNATGLLHSEVLQLKPEKALSQLNLNALQHSFALNAFAPILLLQAVLPSIAKQNPAWIVNLSARVGSISDNRLGGWYAYRAAKSAQNQLFKTAAIELSRSHPQAICLQLHPGTVDSALSKPFQAGVAADKLFTPEQSAAYLLQVIASKTPADTGTFWDWNNTAVAW
jgi:NAD(P)-dependent dehydrogenase (short-subunit alcohol dehydrogenase family)